MQNGWTNIEIKARCSNPESVRQRLRGWKADFVGEDHQVDTYFRVPRGRLKLREGRIERALIYYDRADEEGPKRSDVALQPVEPDAPLKDILVHALGVLTSVDKRREIYFVDNVKFHIDQVEGLGSFVEIEAIDRDGSIGVEGLRRQCERYVAELGLVPESLVPVSYSDLLMEQEARGRAGDDSVEA